MARVGESRNAYSLLVGKSERQRTPRNSKRWMGNVDMDLGVIGWSVIDWIVLAQDRKTWRTFVNAVMDLWVACNA